MNAIIFMTNVSYSLVVFPMHCSIFNPDAMSVRGNMMHQFLQFVSLEWSDEGMVG